MDTQTWTPGDTVEGSDNETIRDNAIAQSPTIKVESQGRTIAKAYWHEGRETWVINILTSPIQCDAGDRAIYRYAGTETDQSKIAQTAADLWYAYTVQPVDCD